MVNCRVDNLGELVEQLRAGGVEAAEVKRRANLCTSTPAKELAA
jgi:hypothetical protein